MVESLLAFMLSCVNCEVHYIRQKNDVKPGEITAKLGKYNLPDEYVYFWEEVSSAEVDGPNDMLVFFSYKEVVGMSEIYSADLPNLFFFGNNGGGQLYAFDIRDEWGNGKNAIYLVPAGLLDKKFSRLIGKDLYEVVKKLNDGVSFLDLPKLE